MFSNTVGFLLFLRTRAAFDRCGAPPNASRHVWCVSIGRVVACRDNECYDIRMGSLEKLGASPTFRLNKVYIITIHHSFLRDTPRQAMHVGVVSQWFLKAATCGGIVWGHVSAAAHLHFEGAPITHQNRQSEKQIRKQGQQRALAFTFYPHGTL